MIAERIERKFFRDIAPRRVHYLQPVSQKDARGLVARVYQQMWRDFELVPPITLHSSVPELLAGSWSIVRESLVAGPVNRTKREAVAAAVSSINECPFCVDVHTSMLHGGKEHEVARTILTDQVDNLPDSKIGSIVKWSLATRSPKAKILDDPPFALDDAPEFIGTALAFHYINRMVNVFLDESPFGLSISSRWLKRFMSRLGGSLIGKRVIGLSAQPGESLQFLSESELSEEFSWASSNPSVAGAFARFGSAVQEAGERFVPNVVRELIQQHVDSWAGEDFGMSRQWVEEAVVGLSESERAAGRLSLLTALASHQVDEEVIASFRKHFLTDAELVAVTSWASFAAVRRISSWLGKKKVVERTPLLVSA